MSGLKMGHMKKIISAGLYIGFCLILLVCIYEKKNLHYDEVLTYVLSNNTSDDRTTVFQEHMVTVENPEQIWLESMTVQKDHRFDYVNVWKKQTADVHPPLYYVLVHTISSLFPGVYSKWFAGIVNICFALLTLFFLRKVSYLLTQSELAVFVSSVGFLFSAGVLSAATFLRMYVVTMFFVTCITYVFLQAIEQRRKEFYLQAGIVSVLGSLTHYYFIIYLFFLCLTFGIYLLVRRAWKDTGIFIGTMAAVGITTILIFPSLLKHMFGGTSRGAETMENLANQSFGYYVSTLKACVSIVNHQLFGGLFFYGLVLLLTVAIVGWVLHRRIEPHFGWVLVWVPVVCYILVISKITVAVTDRYFHPIYGLLLVASISGAVAIFARVLPRGIAIGATAVFVMLTTFLDFRTNWFYLYRSTGMLLQNAKAHANVDCIYVEAIPSEWNVAFLEFRNYRSLTLMNGEELAGLDQIPVDTENGLVVSMGIGGDFETVRAKVQESFPELQDYTELGRHSFTVTYFFSKTE